MAKIPPSLIGTISPILAQEYTHSQLNALFFASGFYGDPPEGNKIDKCQNWLRLANMDADDPLAQLARLIAEYMDTDTSRVANTPWQSQPEPTLDPRQRIIDALAREGLSYQRGGHILGSALTGPSRSLAERLKKEGIQAINVEFERAYSSIEADPNAAVTAASAILESVCKTYLESQGHPLPSKQTLGPLWQETAKQLGLSPKDIADDDLKRILQGLFGIADGVAALRTHEGSAHGRSALSRYKLAARHARLAVHASHTMAMFVLETWEARRS